MNPSYLAPLFQNESSWFVWKWTRGDWTRDFRTTTRFDVEATGNSSIFCFVLQQEFLRTRLQDFQTTWKRDLTFQFSHVVSRVYTRLISQTLMDSSFLNNWSTNSNTLFKKRLVNFIFLFFDAALVKQVKLLWMKLDSYPKPITTTTKPVEDEGVYHVWKWKWTNVSQRLSMFDRILLAWAV